jgi:hypothetical protein
LEDGKWKARVEEVAVVVGGSAAAAGGSGSGGDDDDNDESRFRLELILGLGLVPMFFTWGWGGSGGGDREVFEFCRLFGFVPEGGDEISDPPSAAAAAVVVVIDEGFDLCPTTFSGLELTLLNSPVPMRGETLVCLFGPPPAVLLVPASWFKLLESARSQATEEESLPAVPTSNFASNLTVPCCATVPKTFIVKKNRYWCKMGESASRDFGYVWSVDEDDEWVISIRAQVIYTSKRINNMPSRRMEGSSLFGLDGEGGVRRLKRRCR